MIKAVSDLEVFNLSYNFAIEIFKIARSFPKAETYSLTDQIIRSSRSISANIAEGWGKRIYETNLKSIWFMQWVHSRRQRFGFYLPGIVDILKRMFMKNSVLSLTR